MPRYLASIAVALLSVFVFAQAQSADSVDSISTAALAHALAAQDGSIVVLDVRTSEEYDLGHVPDAINIPHDVVGERITELEPARDRVLVVYCRSGRRVQLAIEALRAAGFTRMRHLEGDYPAWAAEGRPIER